MKFGQLFDVTDDKKLRVIIDTDAACEADDPFAIVHALLSQKFIVRGITAAHFNCKGSVERSLEEIRTILAAMSLTDEIPACLGEQGPIGTVNMENCSPAVDLIIREALSDDPHPLYLLCQGAITNVAVAFRKCPEIISRVHVIWIGTHGEESPIPYREFNAGNDVEAANIVLGSGTDLTVVPSTVYRTINIGIAKLQKDVYPYGPIGRHLFEQLVAYNARPEAAWTKGESWSLGDSPAVAIALNEYCGTCKHIPAPIIGEDTSSTFAPDRPLIRMYTYVDSGYILDDMISKIQLFALSCEIKPSGDHSAPVFRPATRADADAVLKMYKSVIGTPLCVWTEDYPNEFEIESDLSAGTLYVLESDSEVIGAISIYPENEMDGFEVWSIRERAMEFGRVVIRPDYQGRGLSKLLVAGVTGVMRRNAARAIHISVAQKNIAAQKLYRSQGFDFVGETSMYGNDYYLAELPL